MADTAALIAHLPDLPLYRVRVTSDSPGYRLIDYGRRLRSALDEVARINAIGGGLAANAESYDRRTGAVIRLFAPADAAAREAA